MATRFSLGGARILQTLANLRRLPAPSNSSTRLVPATPAAPAGSDIGSTPSKRLFSSTSVALASSDTGFTTISTLKLNNERQPYTTTATIRDKHIVIADEPSSLGGADLGANPYELLLAALGACTNITCSMYARRKGIKLESVETRLKVSKIHREQVIILFRESLSKLVDFIQAKTVKPARRTTDPRRPRSTRLRRSSRSRAI